MIDKRCQVTYGAVTRASASGAEIFKNIMKCQHVSAFFFSSRRRHTRSLRDWSSDRVLFRSPQIGGLWGAERLGLEITYWGDAVTPALLAAIPAGARVAAVPMGIDYVRALQDARFLRAEDRKSVV